MQKWCPEPLTLPSAQAGRYERSVFGATGRVTAFRPEAGFAGADALLRSLSREERAEVARLLEQDLRREFEERQRSDTAAREAAAAAQRQADEAALAAWQDSLASGLEQTVRETIGELARRTAMIAVAMASKVVRREVALDAEVLVRNLETVLYKAAAGSRLSVTVHPEDAVWLADASELCERLRIVDVKADRRLERGGCLVQAGGVEWDATIERQLTTLGEALDTALAVPPPAGGSDDA
jgi:flagellar assembly protein FliH